MIIIRAGGLLFDRTAAGSMLRVLLLARTQNLNGENSKPAAE